MYSFAYRTRKFKLDVWYDYLVFHLKKMYNVYEIPSNKKDYMYLSKIQIDKYFEINLSSITM